MPHAGSEVDVRRAGDRFATSLGWLDSKHSFSFGHHYDPGNTHFGLLLVNNDDVVDPGTGFETHPHRDMEIVTWVLRGQLVHQDSQGHSGLIYPGLAQRMSAGTGILHSEKNDSWRLTGRGGPPGPGALRADVGAAGRGRHHAGVRAARDRRRPAARGLVPVASGMAEHRDAAAIRIAQKDAALFAGRLAAGDRVALPEAAFVHLFVAAGSVELEGTGLLGTGDAARVAGGGGQRITAGPDGAEVLVWEMRSGLGG